MDPGWTAAACVAWHGPVELAPACTAAPTHGPEDASHGPFRRWWRIEDMADDTSRLVNAATGKVADVADCGTGDGVDVRQWSRLNNTCRQWRIVPTTA
ncbi:RICIN domain-containing protein [Streptomyces bluensis]|uniref:RICIN domain-containing protein n=1 Tax=Streptomyces bluensis TaxID=33897 RepID=UPI0036788CF4